MYEPGYPAPVVTWPVYSQECMTEQWEALDNDYLRQLATAKCIDKPVLITLTNDQTIPFTLKYADDNWLQGYIFDYQVAKTTCDNKVQPPSKCINKWTLVQLKDGRTFWFYINHVDAQNNLTGFFHKSQFKAVRCTLAIALKANNGMFVCAEGGGGRELVANRSSAAGWETFLLVPAPDDTTRYVVRVDNGQYLGVDAIVPNPVAADRDMKNAGKFELVNIYGEKYAIKYSGTGKYFTVGYNGRKDIVAWADAIGPAETFTLMVKK